MQSVHENVSLKVTIHHRPKGIKVCLTEGNLSGKSDQDIISDIPHVKIT